MCFSDSRRPRNCGSGLQSGARRQVLPDKIQLPENRAPDIPGALELVKWFGYWPSFHDAEVTSIVLDRSGASRVEVDAFHMSAEVDATSRNVLTQHTRITFHLRRFARDASGVTTTSIDYFDNQNVLSSLGVEKTERGHDLILEGICGVSSIEPIP